mgnify:CR=1 FL=1
MGKTLIFGHKSPDTDTIVSSICMENLKNKLGREIEAVRLGEISKETKYVLNYFGVEAPRKIEEVEDSQDVILVDHNEFAQSVKNIENANVKMVIDHHKISDFQTSEPLYYRAEPVGCTATIVYSLYKENGVELDKKIAGLMLSAIISDTLLFKSPTCTPKDIEVANALAEIAEIDIEKYGLDMLKAGTDLSDLTESELIYLDAKEVSLGNVKAVIAQINSIDLEKMVERKEKLEEQMNMVIEEKGLGIFVLAITDILNSNSKMIVLGKESELFEKAFGVKLEDNMAFLEGVVSRKKQIIPPMMKI